MSKPLAIAILVVGVILLIYGFNASESVTSETSQAFTGTPTDKSMWLIVGGALAAIIGLVSMVRRPRSA